MLVDLESRREYYRNYNKRPEVHEKRIEKSRKYYSKCGNDINAKRRLTGDRAVGSEKYMKHKNYIICTREICAFCRIMMKYADFLLNNDT